MAKRWKYAAAALVLLCFAEVVLLLGISAADATVTVFMYHSVSEEPISDEPELSVKVSELEKQLKFFNDNGIITVFAGELPDVKSDGGRYVALTFDDGYVDNYTQLFPLLKKYNCKATIFMITANINWDGYLTDWQMKEMTDSGLVSVQSHTVSHLPMAESGLDSERVEYELNASRDAIESITGQRVNVLSMPNGSYDKEIMAKARESYDVIFTAADFEPFSSNRLWDVHRIGIYRRHTLDDIKAMTDNRGLYLIKRTLQKLVQR